MQTQTKQKDMENRDREMDEELADVLTAISVVAKRLAKQLQIVNTGAEEAEPHSTNVKGEISDEQDEASNGRCK